MGAENKRYQEENLKCRCCGVKVINGGLIDMLNVIYERFGKYIHINRGYSCPNHNKEVGGVPNSEHPKGNAADIWIEGISPDIVWSFCNEHFTNSGVGRYDTFTHIDCRGKRARWDYRKGKNK